MNLDKVIDKIIDKQMDKYQWASKCSIGEIKDCSTKKYKDILNAAPKFAGFTPEETKAVKIVDGKPEVIESVYGKKGADGKPAKPAKGVLDHNYEMKRLEAEAVEKTEQWLKEEKMDDFATIQARAEMFPDHKPYKEAFQKMQSDFIAEKLSIQADFDFHLRIAQATNNEIFAQLLEDSQIGLKKTIAIGQNLSKVSVKKNTASTRNKEVLEEHQQILNAIELQDPQAARLAMRYHIGRIRQRIINIHEDRPLR